METERCSPDAYRSPAWMRLIIGRSPRWTTVRVLFLIFVSLIVFKFVLLPIRVTGDSMYPTCRNGQIKLVNQLAYFRQKPERGDIVAVEFEGRRVLLLKRIIGLPGELFQVYEGEVYIDNKKLSEPYTRGKIPGPDNRSLGNMDPIRLGKTEYMVIGDNRSISEGYLKDEKQIVGKLL